MDKIFLLTKGMILNIFVLFAVLYIYLSIESRFTKRNNLQTFLLSIFAGFGYLIIILSAFQIEEGVYLDVRAVFAGVSGLYFGVIPTVVGAILGVVIRLILGGVGSYGGIFEIIVPVLIGILVNRLNLFNKLKEQPWFLYLFSLAMYIISLVAVFLVPNSKELFKTLVIPYIFIFPFTTMLVSSTMVKRINFLSVDEKLRFKEKLIHASINSTSLEEIFAVDRNYKYLYFNESHKNEMFKITNLEIKENTSALSYFSDPKIINFLKNKLDYGMINNNSVETFKSEIYLNRHVEARYRNIFIDNKFIGLAVSLLDVTMREKNNKEIKKLSYIDQLTNLHNRRYYDENISKYDLLPNVTVVYVDINGLKLINDSFGHHTGDKLIVMVSKVLRDYFEFDERIMLARTGGDEFIIICNNCNFDEINNIMKEVEKELNSLSINNLKVLISYGIKTKEKGTDSLDYAIKEAENIMYEKKLLEITSHRNDSIKQLLNMFREMYPEERRHSNCVSEITQAIGTALDLQTYELSLLRLISRYHDIGKVSLPSEIINKHELTHQEEALLKTHPEIGYRIMGSSPEYAVISNDILSHHENYDGSGYPRKLKGTEIPLKSRIVRIAEELDGLLYDRYGKGVLSFDLALEQIKTESGKKFDPKLVDILVRLSEKGLIRKYNQS